MAEDLTAVETQLDVWKQGARETEIPQRGRAVVGLQLLLGAGRGIPSMLTTGGVVSKQTVENSHSSVLFD